MESPPRPTPGVVLRNSMRKAPAPAYLLVVQEPDPARLGWIKFQWIDRDDGRRPAFNVDPIPSAWDSTSDLDLDSSTFWLREEEWDRYLGAGGWLHS